MRLVDLSRYAFTACVGAALVSGCGGSQLPIGAPSILQNATMHRLSASSYELLYASVGDRIYVLSFPGGSLEESFDGPGEFVNGACPAPNGDIFVTGGQALSVGYIWEYAPGGTSPIATLDDIGYTPLTCSVDPTTGNLSVVNAPSGSDVSTVAIYTDAQGNPTYYSDSDMRLFYGCAYDNDGNLFIDGKNESLGSGRQQLIELPEGSSTFTSISMSRIPLEFPGVMQWQGSHLAISYNGNRVYSVKVSGTTGTIIGTTRLKGAALYEQPWTQGSVAAAPYTHNANEIALYAFPKGGKPSGVIDFGLSKKGTIYYVAIDVVPGAARRPMPRWSR
jgi:WD40 repeat protein